MTTQDRAMRFLAPLFDGEQVPFRLAEGQVAPWCPEAGPPASRDLHDVVDAILSGRVDARVVSRAERGSLPAVTPYPLVAVEIAPPTWVPVLPAGSRIAWGDLSLECRALLERLYTLHGDRARTVRFEVGARAPHSPPFTPIRVTPGLREEALAYFRTQSGPDAGEIVSDDGTVFELSPVRRRVSVEAEPASPGLGG